MAEEELKTEVARLTRKVAEMDTKLKDQSEMLLQMMENVTTSNLQLTKLETEIEKLRSAETTKKSGENSAHFLPADISSQFPQMTCFHLSTSHFQPDFVWEITGIGKLLKNQAFKIKSNKIFSWTGYPEIQAQAKLELLKEKVYASLTLSTAGKTTEAIKPVPAVYYVLKDRSGSGKHVSRVTHYLFTSVFNPCLTFEQSLVHRSWLTHPAYNRDDSIFIEVYVEPPSLARRAHSLDGTLSWAVENYRRKKRMERQELVQFQESPYFYTGVGGYRVRVRLWLDGYGGAVEGCGLTAEVSFLTGLFDADLPAAFPHRTTVTLYNPKDPRCSVTRTVDRNVGTEMDYLIDMCMDEEMEKIVVNDTLFYNVTIKSLR